MLPFLIRDKGTLIMKTDAEDWSGDLGQTWRDHLDGLEATLEPINDALVEGLDLAEARHIADIGCGGGGLTRHLALRAPQSADTVGLDISQDLVEAARDRATSLGIEFKCTNAETDPLVGSAYDRLASRFGVMFFNDEKRAFQNMRSWMTPGGRFAFAVWADLSDNPWMAIIRKIGAQFVDIPEASDHAPGPFRYANIDRLTDLLTRTGYSGLDIQDWQNPVQLAGGQPADRAAAFGLSAFWSEIKPGTADYEQAYRQLTKALADYEKDGAVTMPARATIVRGYAA